MSRWGLTWPVSSNAADRATITQDAHSYLGYRYGMTARKVRDGLASFNTKVGDCERTQVHADAVPDRRRRSDRPEGDILTARTVHERRQRRSRMAIAFCLFAAVALVGAEGVAFATDQPQPWDRTTQVTIRVDLDPGQQREQSPTPAQPTAIATPPVNAANADVTTSSVSAPSTTSRSNTSIATGVPADSSTSEPPQSPSTADRAHSPGPTESASSSPAPTETLDDQPPGETQDGKSTN
jgi:hypothetical protein